MAGGFPKAVERALGIGANCFQIFAGSPRSFKEVAYSGEILDKFNQMLLETGLGPVFFHGVYLINLAAADQRLYELSIQSLIFYLKLCQRIKVEGVIFHIGSHGGLGYEAVKKRVYTAVERILAQTTKGRLILENNAGQGGGIGVRFEEISDIINYIRSDRLAVCLDSQHAFAAGYPLEDAAGLETTIEQFDQTVGLANLTALHLNDSKFPQGSRRDRHENIGEGLIGLAAVKNILNHPRLRHLPFVIETPGFENKGPDKKNMEILKSLLD